MGKAERQQKRLAAGWQAIERGDFRSADEIAGNALRNTPSDIDFLALFGTSLFHQRRYGEAVVPLREIFSRTRTQGIGTLLGQCYLSAGDAKSAETVLRQEVQLFPDLAEAMNLLGISLVQQSRHQEAIALFESALRHSPRFVEAHLNLGNALYQTGRHEEAISWFEKTIELRPDFPAAHSGLGSAHRAVRHFEAAVDSCRTALQFAPEDPGAHTNLGNVLEDAGRPEEAIASFRAALAIDPDYAPAHNSLGSVLGALRRYDEAVECFKKALALSPDYAEAHTNLGVAYQRQRRFDDAIACHRRAISIEPHYAEAHVNLGTIYQDQRRLDDAVACYQRALSVNPDFAMAYTLLGTICRKQERIDDAIAFHQKALSINPHLAEACTNLGVVYQVQKRFDEAEALHQKAILLKPDLAEAHHNLGVVYQELTRHPEAIGCFRKVLAIEPDHEYAFSGLLWSEQLACCWGEFDNRVEGLRRRVRERQSMVQPLLLLAVSHDPEEHRVGAESYIRDKVPQPPPPLWQGTRYRHPKIRVAYLSADFREHVVAHCIAELFELHDRSKFESIGVSFGFDDGSEQRSRLVKSLDRFVDVRIESDASAAGLLREMEVDIAVDLMGYTKDSRPEILSFRPAPIQVSYLGYPGTMSAEFIDYILADKFVLPEEHQTYFSEKAVYLPDCYQANDSKRRISDRIPTRAEVGLPQTGFVFCSFNNNYKITPRLFDVWMRLLSSLPSSVLWLFRDHALAEENLRKEARARGVDPNRLVFAPRVEIAEYRGRCRLADLCLDTLPYNGHGTTSDMLWAGLPVLTCAGTAFAGRVAGSLLRAVGLPELVTGSLEEYEALAMKLATDPRQLAEIRGKLARNRLTTPLFDTDRFRRHIESAYVTMWEIWQRGEKPRAFEVGPSE
jgi:predicted O-linked N-acetylglucosamine transferase (SPINDLY family)